MLFCSKPSQHVSYCTMAPCWSLSWCRCRLKWFKPDIFKTNKMKITLQFRVNGFPVNKSSVYWAERSHDVLILRIWQILTNVSWKALSSTLQFRQPMLVRWRLLGWRIVTSEVNLAILLGQYDHCHLRLRAISDCWLAFLQPGWWILSCRMSLCQLALRSIRSFRQYYVVVCSAVFALLFSIWTLRKWVTMLRRILWLGCWSVRPIWHRITAGWLCEAVRNHLAL